ncbi:hypothetical protein AVEN_132019-1 [Araneus ventricosus]|uniref:Uncharacterized protein n=1 Tax=Araneus ventricosus TaxID=182803 RepID=A0A4Y2B2S5_ARAVE|nr:hypothetical protein AVEN_132019-1 [Araneus ventricosus]
MVPVRRRSQRFNRCGKARNCNNGEQEHQTWCSEWKTLFSAMAELASHTQHRIWEYSLAVRPATFTCPESSKNIWVEDNFPSLTRFRQLF